MTQRHAQPRPQAPRAPMPGPSKPRTYRFTDWAAL